MGRILSGSYRIHLIGVFATARGTPILSLEIDGRLVLDLALQGIDIQALTSWLETLRIESQKSPPKLS